MADAKSITIEPIAPDEAEEVESMARTIWPLVYSKIISAAQIEYMLDWMYSPDRIREEINERGISYFWIMSDGKRVGFLAGGPREGDAESELHKLYLHPGYHGTGVATRGIATYFDHLREAGRHRVHLRVNRGNRRALSFYRKHGFTVEEEDRAAIGSGFYMDDFLLSKDL